MPKITRRNLLKGMATVAALPAVQSAEVKAWIESSKEAHWPPYPAILDYLETLKAKLKPVNDYIAYLEQAARGGKVDPDMLVILWDGANDAAHNHILEMVDTKEFHKKAVFPFVDEDAYWQACARNMPGFEL